MLRITSLDEHCEATRCEQLSETMLVDLSARRRHADDLVEHHLAEAVESRGSNDRDSGY